METTDLIILLVALAGYMIGVSFGLLIGLDLGRRSKARRRSIDEQAVESNLLAATRGTFIR